MIQSLGQQSLHKAPTMAQRQDCVERPFLFLIWVQLANAEDGGCV